MGARLAALPRAFYARPTAEVAADLLGKLLVRRRAGRPDAIVRLCEVEAYLGERDRASHARFGPTPRARIMFGPPGHLYVYLVYGMHHCLNVVTERDGVAGAVLLRAAEAVAGLERSTSGPGRLALALGLDRRDDGRDVCAGPVYLADDGLPPPRRARTARVGVDYAGAWARRRLRFVVPGHPALSAR